MINRLSKQLKSARVLSRIKPRSALVLLMLLLFLTATSALAQEADPVDGPVPYNPEGVVVSETVLPYGVQSVMNVSTTKDSFLSSLHANSNYGFWTTMGLGYSSGDFNAMRMLYEFNIGSIPSNAIINKAEIFIYQQSVNPSSQPSMGFKAQYMKSQWNEGSVTWNNANYLGGSEIGVGNINNNLGWKTGDVTDLVKRWHSGAQSNYGMILTGNEGTEPPYNRFFRSRQYSGYAPYIRVDYTNCSDTTRPTASMTPLPTWSPSSFKVKWSGTDHNGSGIAWYDVQYSINGSNWVEWKHHTTSTSATYNGGTTGQHIQFRTRAADHCGNVGDWTGTTATSVDNTAPNVSVNQLPQFTLTSNFIVSWSGSDNGSGIKNMDVQYRDETLNGNWINWQTGTTQFSAQFTGAINTHTYEFRARGTDNVGNVQAWSGPQAQTTVFFNPIAWVLPFPNSTTSSSPFEVRWDGVTPGGTLMFDIYYRFDSGTWIKWQNGVTIKSADFIPSDGNGLYQFAAVGKNSLGGSEGWDSQPEEAIIYNSDPDAFSHLLFPVIFQD